MFYVSNYNMSRDSRVTKISYYVTYGEHVRRARRQSTIRMRVPFTYVAKQLPRSLTDAVEILRVVPCTSAKEVRGSLRITRRG